MIKSQGTEYIHWLGIEMMPARALMLESFKKRNENMCAEWRAEWPEFCRLYPIYWETEKQRWVWSIVHKKDIVEYIKLCELFLQERIRMKG